ncbi:MULTISPECIES: class B sortase [unclassified Butyrivibrio]|uniref:class B sortase n=1 Tax=unclassified Butyrivibrio TaxID=2639466 RepID=UPI00040573CE|nr:MULTISPECIES: class B sortase [unclassified Butyrivibrio]
MSQNKESKADKIAGNSAFRVIRILLVIVLLGIVVYEGIMFYRDQKEYAVAVNEYDDLRDNYITEKEDTIEDVVVTDDNGEIIGTYPNLDINFDALEEINSDFIGWLYFPAVSKINYPVVKEQTIDQYLYRTFDGKYNKAGCIFMDVLSDENFCGYSDMVFGHNMKNNSMFGSLKSIYKSGGEDVIKDNPYVYIYTKDQVLKYRIFAYYRTTQGSYSYTEVTNEEEYDDYLKYISRNTMYEIPSELSFGDYPSLLTLSTCSGQSGSGQRFVLHTVKVQTFDK